MNLKIVKNVSYEHKEGGVKDAVLEVKPGVVAATPYGNVVNKGNEVILQGRYEVMPKGSSYVLSDEPKENTLTLMAGTDKQIKINDGDTLISTEVGPADYGAVTTTLEFQFA